MIRIEVYTMAKKPLWKSKTIWAAGVIALSGVLTYFGVDIPTELIVTLAGSFGIYGIRDAVNKNK